MPTPTATPVPTFGAEEFVDVFGLTHHDGEFATVATLPDEVVPALFRSADGVDWVVLGSGPPAPVVELASAGPWLVAHAVNTAGPSTWIRKQGEWTEIAAPPPVSDPLPSELEWEVETIIHPVGSDVLVSAVSRMRVAADAFDQPWTSVNPAGEVRLEDGSTRNIEFPPDLVGEFFDLHRLQDNGELEPLMQTGAPVTTALNEIVTIDGQAHILRHTERGTSSRQELMKIETDGSLNATAFVDPSTPTGRFRSANHTIHVNGTYLYALDADAEALPGALVSEDVGETWSEITGLNRFERVHPGPDGTGFLEFAYSARRAVAQSGNGVTMTEVGEVRTSLDEPILPWRSLAIGPDQLIALDGNGRLVRLSDPVPDAAGTRNSLEEVVGLSPEEIVELAVSEGADVTVTAQLVVEELGYLVRVDEVLRRELGSSWRLEPLGHVPVAFLPREGRDRYDTLSAVLLRARNDETPGVCTILKLDVLSETVNLVAQFPSAESEELTCEGGSPVVPARDGSRMFLVFSASNASGEEWFEPMILSGSLSARTADYTFDQTLTNAALKDRRLWDAGDTESLSDLVQNLGELFAVE